MLSQFLTIHESISFFFNVSFTSILFPITSHDAIASSHYILLRPCFAPKLFLQIFTFIRLIPTPSFFSNSGSLHFDVLQSPALFRCCAYLKSPTWSLSITIIAIDARSSLLERTLRRNSTVRLNFISWKRR